MIKTTKHLTHLPMPGCLAPPSKMQPPPQPPPSVGLAHPAPPSYLQEREMHPVQQKGDGNNASCSAAGTHTKQGSYQFMSRLQSPIHAYTIHHDQHNFTHCCTHIQLTPLHMCIHTYVSALTQERDELHHTWGILHFIRQLMLEKWIPGQQQEVTCTCITPPTTHCV